jgi:hypothetical protein
MNFIVITLNYGLSIAFIQIKIVLNFYRFPLRRVYAFLSKKPSFTLNAYFTFD